MSNPRIHGLSMIGLLSSLALLPAAAHAQKIWQENGTGYVIMEAENTESDLGKCWKETKPPGYTGRSALENTCNNPSVGPPQQPLKYTVKIKEGGQYSLHLHIYKNLQGEEPDKCNDVYIKVEGDYAAGAGAPVLADLKKDNKHYGGDHSKSQWSGDKPIDVHEKKWAATYVFKAGETYTLTMSGRAQRANINRLVFTTAAAKEKALNPATPESIGTPTTLLAPAPGIRMAAPGGFTGAPGASLIGVDGRRTRMGDGPGKIPASGIRFLHPGSNRSTGMDGEAGHGE